MKNLIKHLLINNLEEIQKKSLLNCHCMGLHSIMLLESPGKTIRLYVADVGNELYKNYPTEIYNNGTLSLGFHDHHCNLTLDVIKGELLNWTIIQSDRGFNEPGMLTKFKYQSAILNGSMEIIDTYESIRLCTKKIERLPYGHSTHMLARDIHTVACYPDQVTAWLVYEGLENNEYEPFIYHNANISTPNLMHSLKLYQKPTYSQIIDLLRKAELYND